MNALQAELPKYKCHKEVWALKIGGISNKPNPDTTGNSGASSYGATLLPSDPRYAPFDVPAEYVTKHHPEVGGYYVVYADGYKSYSPAQAFEEGYMPIPAGSGGPGPAPPPPVKPPKH